MRLSKSALRFEARQIDMIGYRQIRCEVVSAMATELLQLREFRDAVMLNRGGRAFHVGGGTCTTGCVICGLADAIAREAERMKEETDG